MMQESTGPEIEGQRAEDSGGDGDVAPRPPIATTGTGSYIAVTCSVMAALLTLILVAGLLIVRWLT